ncbi:MAG: type IIL restriction-modification enzyme MmeI, partial [Opitutaceae bacterium]
MSACCPKRFYFFGVLHSRFHELWALATGTQLREKESGFRYTPTTCFETFPFPWPLGGERAALDALAQEGASRAWAEAQAAHVYFTN